MTRHVGVPKFPNPTSRMETALDVCCVLVSFMVKGPSCRFSVFMRECMVEADRAD